MKKLSPGRSYQSYFYDTQNVLKKIRITIIFVLAIYVSIPEVGFGESLWDDSYSSVYAHRTNFKINDSIRIKITEKNILDYKSSVKTIKNITTDIKTSEITGVFELIPAGSIEESKNAQEKDQFTFSNSLSARITAVYPDYLSIEAVKNVSVNNKNAQIRLLGDIARKEMTGDYINSDSIMNLTLQITTLLDNTEIPVNDSDFIRESTTESTVNENGETIETTVETGAYTLTDEKKKEFLLEYLNKILNVVF